MPDYIILYIIFTFFIIILLKKDVGTNSKGLGSVSFNQINTYLVTIFYPKKYGAVTTEYNDEYRDYYIDAQSAQEAKTIAEINYCKKYETVTGVVLYLGDKK